MKLISTLVASAAVLGASSFVSANAITPAGLANAQSGMVEPVARVCREVRRRGFCKETCRWEPNRPRVRIIERDRGRDHHYRDRDRGSGVELRIGR